MDEVEISVSPKKGNLHDLNNWRGTNLLGVVSKVVSIMLNVRSQKLLKKNGHPMQLAATPKAGCAEAVFSLKKMLQSRRENGVDSCAIFINLMKAYDSTNHEIISLASKKMGAPDECVKWVETLCGDFEVVLNIGREEISFKHDCGVRKGVNLAPTLFTMSMQLVPEDMLDKLKKKK